MRAGTAPRSANNGLYESSNFGGKVKERADGTLYVLFANAFGHTGTCDKMFLPKLDVMTLDPTGAWTSLTTETFHELSGAKVQSRSYDMHVADDGTVYVAYVIAPSPYCSAPGDFFDSATFEVAIFDPVMGNWSTDVVNVYSQDVRNRLYFTAARNVAHTTVRFGVAPDGTMRLMLMVKKDDETNWHYVYKQASWGWKSASTGWKGFAESSQEDPYYLQDFYVGKDGEYVAWELRDWKMEKPVKLVSISNQGVKTDLIDIVDPTTAENYEEKVWLPWATYAITLDPVNKVGWALSQSNFDGSPLYFYRMRALP